MSSLPPLIGAIAVSALLQLLVLTMPFLQPLFKVAPVPFAWEWLLVALLAFVPVTIVEVTKLLRAKQQPAPEESAPKVRKLEEDVPEKRENMNSLWVAPGR